MITENIIHSVSMTHIESLPVTWDDVQAGRVILFSVFADWNNIDIRMH